MPNEQSVQRLRDLLTIVASGGEDGVRLDEIARRYGPARRRRKLSGLASWLAVVGDTHGYIERAGRGASGLYRLTNRGRVWLQRNRPRFEPIRTHVRLPAGGGDERARGLPRHAHYPPEFEQVAPSYPRPQLDDGRADDDAYSPSSPPPRLPR